MPNSLIQVKRSRGDKQEHTRRALLEAALSVVGEEGYALATVSKMTARANIANGTFYNYFKNQQDIFDQLLPFLGERLMAHIRAKLDPQLTGAARERARFIAYFDFCRRNPGFLRILNEAEIFAPAAYHRHVVAMYEGYLKSLERSSERDEIRSYSREELGPMVFMLMGIRSYMTMLFQYKYIDRSSLSVDALADIYEKFVSSGLFSVAASERSSNALTKSGGQ
ncbi:MAG: TetR/AcrR family transcriptional regulator [Hydrogenophaga sp.]|uniref:TetR/AcrR family transcriptional regulator n=1 Tax=Hydrogenophaga sp. TaxID=1904254 RepID=UPI0026276BD2|nr:TetR/AcrR family transcriptional regulator [Hydrogenophaga sp.]MCV0438916.1 TetR/AcrR family transcriptional regulator [Hydrogenophaga sp.]